MAYEIRRTKDSIQDLDAIFDHLVSTYLGFGDELQVAYERAGKRVRGITADMFALAAYPHRGKLDAGLGFGLQRFDVENAIRIVGDDRIRRTVFADPGGERAGVDAREANDAAALQPGVEMACGTII